MKHLLELTLALTFIVSWAIAFYMTPIKYIREYGQQLYVNISILSATLIGFLIVTHQLIVSIITSRTLYAEFMARNEGGRDYIVGLLRYISIIVLLLLFSMIISLVAVWFNVYGNKIIFSTIFAILAVAFTSLFLVIVNIFDIHRIMLLLEEYRENNKT